jgi:hypothetical protein
MMRCSRCHRSLKSPAVISRGLTLGPVCARRLGISLEHSKRPGRVPVVQAGQLALFETEQVAA